MKRIAFLFLALAFLPMGSDVSAQEFQVVVNSSMDITEISADDLSRIFRKKDDRLPSGEAAQPVDQAPSAAVREAFSEAVHGKTIKQIESYWQQQIFAGREIPPESKSSDEDVLAWVRSTPGAIGYVSGNAPVDGVKVVRVAG